MAEKTFGQIRKEALEQRRKIETARDKRIAELERELAEYKAAIKTADQMAQEARANTLHWLHLAESHAKDVEDMKALIELLKDEGTLRKAYVKLLADHKERGVLLRDCIDALRACYNPLRASRAPACCADAITKFLNRPDIKALEEK